MITALALALALQQVAYPPLPNGMRIVVGATGALARTGPAFTFGCGPDNHPCVDKDAIPPNTIGTVLSDPPVYEPAGWYWSRIAYDNGVTGWSSGYPPYVNVMVPPTMISGQAFAIVADYNGPMLTDATCINDGVTSAAQRVLQPQPDNTVKGTIQCPMNAATPNGNHITVIVAINSVGSAPSGEFQFAVAPSSAAPATKPINLRIALAALFPFPFLLINLIRRLRR